MSSTGIRLFELADKEMAINIFDRVILFSLSSLIFVLPIAHTAAIRSALIIISILLWLGKMFIEKRLIFERTPLDIPILLFFITAVASIFTAVDPRYTIRAIRSDLLEPIVIFYIVVNNIKTKEQAKVLLLSLFLGAFVMTTYGIYDFFVSGGSLVDYYYRAHSLHDDFQYYGSYLTIIFPYIFLAIFYFLERRLQAPILFLLLLTTFSIYITYTRAAWVAVYVESIFVIFVIFNKKWIPVSIVILTFLIPYLVPQKALYREAGKSLIDLDTTKIEQSTISRLYTWKFSIKEISKNPFKGIGFGRNSFTKKYVEDIKKNSILGHSHNAFIDLTLQTGIQGLIAFFLIIYHLLKTHWTNYKQESDTFRLFTLATLVMAIGFLIRNMFDSFFLDDPWLMFWLLNGVGLVRV